MTPINPAGPQQVHDNPYRQGQDAETARHTRAKDQELIDHLCGHACGCGGGAGSVGDDPLKALEERDWEVRQHEHEHFGKAGEFACGGPVFETVTASNGRSYVVGGHVNVSVAEVPGDPKATIAKMRQIQKAALAPAAPSDQDRRVAAMAATKEQEAHTKLGHQENGWNLAPGARPEKRP